MAHTKEQAAQFDKLFISFHFHQSPEKKRISKVLFKVCRAFIDSGASGVLVHGGHRIKGFEVYKNKPIFYGVGNLFYHAQWVKRRHPEFVSPKAKKLGMTYEEYNTNRRIWNAEDVFEAIMPVCSFNDKNEIEHIDLYPIDLGFADK